MCAVVAPWNFPLAIATGMTAAALVTGNAVVLKPAEQTPAVAAEIAAAFMGCGLPGGVLSFLPGTGEEAGAALVAHPGVDVIAFTGSRPVGLGIVEVAGRPLPGRGSIVKVIVELGGKNPIVVDSDADLDEVVPAVVASAFGFAGQKCSAASRLIIVDTIHDAVVSRVVEAVRSLVVAPPRDPVSQVGPVIDADAQRRLQAALSSADRIRCRGNFPNRPAGQGFLCGPHRRHRRRSPLGSVDRRALRSGAGHLPGARHGGRRRAGQRQPSTR